jgi:hypothetical protein
MQRVLFGLIVTLLVAVAAPPRAVEACAGIGRSGPVFVRGEEALVVWDEARHLEHFVRRAFFDGVREDFGFLVPTPTRPELAEVSSRVFAELFTLYRMPPRRSSRSRGTSGAGRHASAADAVVVLEERTVAGMDAAVLAASDPHALEGWLRSHGYPSGAALTSYVAPYVSAGWIITAFRIAPGSLAAAPFSSASVRMSFSTERPFFPYSEPQLDAAPRRFRVSVASPGRVRAYLDRPTGGARAPWIEPAYAGRPSALRRVLSPVLAEGVSAGPWLTTFDERASRRGELDLFFEPDPEQRARASRITSQIRP